MSDSCAASMPAGFGLSPPTPLRCLDLLIPELYAGDGGIQVYSRTLIHALGAIRPHCRLRVFIRNDQPQHLSEHLDRSLDRSRHRAKEEAPHWFAAAGSNRAMAAALLGASARRRADLLLCTHPNFAPLLGLYQRLTGTPAWCVAHGIDVWSLPDGLLRRSLSGLQRLLPVSRFTAARLQQHLSSRCPALTVLPNSYDERRFTPGPRPGRLLHRYQLRSDQPLILTLARLSRRDRYKNIAALLRALPLLLQRWPDLRLMVAGDGDDRPVLQEQARQLGVAAAVIFTGRLPETDLVDHYRLATLFALPSEKEGFGIVFLEALGCGLPVLAGNRDGSVDPLADGLHGLLVDPVLPLAPALQALLERRGETLWFQPEALSRTVAERFGFAALCRRLDQLLQEHERTLALDLRRSGR